MDHDWTLACPVIGSVGEIKTLWLYKVKLLSCKLPLSTQCIRRHNIYLWPIECSLALSDKIVEIQFFCYPFDRVLSILPKLRISKILIRVVPKAEPCTPC